ncbi:MAG: hypothetical protein ACSHXK_07930 [Oceanococcus sp.]
MTAIHKLLQKTTSIALLGLISACNSGNYSGLPVNVESANGGQGNDSGTSSAGAHFEQNVQSKLEFCRTCHIPQGVADTEEGRRFMLSQNPDQDYENTYAAWIETGEGVNDNLVLTMPSGTGSRSHSGGEPWPTSSQAYGDMQKLLQCWETPDQCAATLEGDGNTTDGEDTSAFPLLGSKRGGHVWAEFCSDAPDDAALPLDPRNLLNTVNNAQRGVAFNVDWRECSLNDPLRPTNCGEYRTAYALGELVGRGQGKAGTAHMFSGDANRGVNFSDPSTWDTSASMWTITAEDYNNVWQSWSGYNFPPADRPDNFDELISQRYGSPLPVEANPYPLPGEDANANNGGSGQLPLAFTQLRDEDGNWSGTIGVKLCSLCHDGQLQSADQEQQVIYGGAGTIGDFTVAFRDFAASGAPQFGLLSGAPLTIAANRGTGAIDQFQLGFILFNGGAAEEFSNEKILFSQAIGNIKSPPWWNLGSRPQKFHGAVLPTDSARIDMAAYYPSFGGPSDPVAWTDSVAYPFQLWAESLKSPEYPGAIDQTLAEQGAVLFHAKDLWSDQLNNPVATPSDRGNGSCASCHGAYSPRYVNDPQMLADPRLQGIAANISAMTTIGTDPAYADAMQSLRNADGSANAAAQTNPFLACGLGSGLESESNTPVMLAPPLHGIWASAPYFHNASVPNIWGVLDPNNERPDIWQRQSAPAPNEQEGRVVMGFDTSLDRAYDHDKLGWKYQTLDCVADAAQTAPLLNCNPLPLALAEDAEESPLQPLLDLLYSELALTWNLSVDEANVIPFTDQQIENRKVYNTNLYAQGNQGHAFTSVLTDAERRALIEYLKTL